MKMMIFFLINRNVSMLISTKGIDRWNWTGQIYRNEWIENRNNFDSSCCSFITKLWNCGVHEINGFEEKKNVLNCWTQRCVVPSFATIHFINEFISYVEHMHSKFSCYWNYVFKRPQLPMNAIKILLSVFSNDTNQIKP